MVNIGEETAPRAIEEEMFGGKVRESRGERTLGLDDAVWVKRFPQG
jgi:hypothetical protein